MLYLKITSLLPLALLKSEDTDGGAQKTPKRYLLQISERIVLQFFVSPDFLAFYHTPWGRKVVT